MGNSASKAARKYPTRPPGQAAPHITVPKAINRPMIENTKPVADSHRSQVIEKDGADPQFLSNLSSLGQVRVDHRMESIPNQIRPEASHMTRLFESRAKSDLSSSQPTENIMNSTALSELFDRRKSVQTQKDLEKLSSEFGIKADVLDNLTRFVNSPSIDSSSIRPAAGKSEEEGFVATAVWMEPRLK